MLPHEPACKAGAFLVEPRSHMKNQTHRRTAHGGQVSRLHQLGLESSALLVEPPPYEARGCCDVKLVRLPGIAPGSPPWQRGILLLNHSRVLKISPAGRCAS